MLPATGVPEEGAGEDGVDLETQETCGAEERGRRDEGR